MVFFKLFKISLVYSNSYICSGSLFKISFLWFLWRFCAFFYISGTFFSSCTLLFLNFFFFFCCLLRFFCCFLWFLWGFATFFFISCTFFSIFVIFVLFCCLLRFLCCFLWFLRRFFAWLNTGFSTGLILVFDLFFIFFIFIVLIFFSFTFSTHWHRIVTCFWCWISCALWTEASTTATILRFFLIYRIIILTFFNRNWLLAL